MLLTKSLYENNRLSVESELTFSTLSRSCVAQEEAEGLEVRSEKSTRSCEIEKEKEERTRRDCSSSLFLSFLYPLRSVIDSFFLVYSELSIHLEIP